MRRIAVFAILCLAAMAMAETYTNPILSPDMPDPGVKYLVTNYWKVSTTDNNADPNKFPIHASRYSLNSWKWVGFVFPEGRHPVWAEKDFWAPEIHEVNGQFVVYYTARDRAGVLNIGAAFCNNPIGPWQDIGKPLYTDPDIGNIDATFWHDERTRTNYLIWKEDGNAQHREKTPFYIAPLSKDGLSIVGPKRTLMVNDQAWEGPLIEGPYLVFRNDYYYLFYSGNGYCSPSYAVGVARSKSLFGPYEKFASNPIVRSNDVFQGPGHCSLEYVDGNRNGTLLMFYHAWEGKPTCGFDRVTLMDPIVWRADGWPSIAGGSPSTGARDIPEY